MSTNSAYNIKFQIGPNLRTDDSTLTKQEDIESEISKKLNTIDGIKDDRYVWIAYLQLMRKY